MVMIYKLICYFFAFRLPRLKFLFHIFMNINNINYTNLVYEFCIRDSTFGDYAERTDANPDKPGGLVF